MLELMLINVQGYKVAAIDIKQTSLDLVNSQRLKPDVCLLSGQPLEDAMEQLTEAIPGLYPGLDATILATDQPSAFDFAAGVTKRHGTMVLLGQPKEGINMSYYNVIYRDLKLVGSLVADAPDAQELIDLVAKHHIEVKVKCWKMKEVEEMKKEYESGEGDGKNVVVL